MQNDKFAKWLTDELEIRGWSQRELARRAGLSSASVSHVISGSRPPKWEFCKAIADALGTWPIKIFQLAGLLPPETELPSSREDELLRLFRILDEHQQENAVNLINLAASGVIQLAPQRKKELVDIQKQEEKASKQNIEDPVVDFF